MLTPKSIVSIIIVDNCCLCYTLEFLYCIESPQLSLLPSPFDNQPDIVKPQGGSALLCTFAESDLPAGLTVCPLICTIVDFVQLYLSAKGVMQ